MKDTTIIIPIKDEEVGLEFLFSEYSNSKLFNKPEIKFIFIIDGRTCDSSKEIAQKFSDSIIDQRETHGKGAAIQQAISKWTKSKTPYIIFIDADGSYPFLSIDDIILALQNGADVVSGSRFLGSNGKPNGMGIIHIFGNKILSKISSIKNRRKISDLCTGLWGFKSEALDVLNIQSKGFDLEAEIAGLIRKERLNHIEIPITWRKRKGGKSKLKSFRDGFIIFLRILRT